jgi:uracil phosphoribosyltransferase
MSAMAAELEHGYGPNVHILDDVYLTSLLARVGHPDTTMPQMRGLLALAYERLLGAVLACELPTVEARVPTRMAKLTEHGHYQGTIVDPATRVVIGCLVRAGVVPAEVCLEILASVIEPANLRLDFLSMSRRVDAAGRVVGTDDAGIKIGGPIRDAILLLPDPMGATGGTVRRTLEVYAERGLGPARKAIALPMIATPEFMRAVAEHCPELIVYTGRLDRGLSPPEVLRRPPGTVPGERGLTDNQYIVPGAGGIGEVLTNSWV